MVKGGKKPTSLLYSMTSKDTLRDGPDPGPRVPLVVPPKRKYTKDELKGDVQYLNQRVTTWLLEGDRLERLMEESKLKEVMVTLGIATEKLLLLEGQPTQIISTQQQQSLDQALPLLLLEMQRRGLKASLTERTMDVTVPPATLLTQTLNKGKESPP